jgi:hypothetical protein
MNGDSVFDTSKKKKIRQRAVQQEQQARFWRVCLLANLLQHTKQHNIIKEMVEGERERENREENSFIFLESVCELEWVYLQWVVLIIN